MCPSNSENNNKNKADFALPYSNFLSLLDLLGLPV